MENNGNLYLSFTSHKGQVWDKINKQNFKKGNTFLDFRGYGPKKDLYYERSKGLVFIVKNDKKIIGKARLITKKYAWSDEISLDVIRNMTLPGFTKNDWSLLMNEYYENPKVFGYILEFDVIEVAE
jgi:hypothetical protein